VTHSSVRREQNGMGPLSLRTAPAKARGERLYPPRSSRVHWILTAIRVEMELVIERFVPGLPDPESSLIDFGCGNMPYRPLFEPHVGEYVGCDLPGNELADCILQTPDRLPQSDGSAAFALSASVLEHVVDPAAYLAECHRVLAKDGLLILSTHGVWRYHPDPLDLWRWTGAGLKHVIQATGFSILHFRGILGPAPTALQLWQDATLPTLPSPFRPLFIHIMQRWIRHADQKCAPEQRDADASVYLLVARKAARP
jgi:SAM-dependent methyltransferase